MLDRLASLQVRRPLLIVAIAAALAALSLPLVLQLGLNSSWTALLPRNKPSVQDLEKLDGRIGGLATLTIAIESKDAEAMQRFARDLVPRLQKLDPKVVRSIDWNVATYDTFLSENKHLFVDLKDLREIRDSLEERLDWEKYRQSPLYLDLEEAEDEKPESPKALVERFKKRDETRKKKLAKYPGGFYLHRDRDLLAVFIRANLKGGDVAGGQRLIDSVDTMVHELGPASYAGDLGVRYAGGIVINKEEHDAIARELVLATALTMAAVLLAIFVFFRRLRAIPLLGLGLVVPVTLTFAFAELAVDYLNTSTAFLGSIVIGNGVNPNIIWLARYFEERRKGANVEDAVLATHRGVWLATFTASLAAAIAYGSLVVTDFRGFRDFGIIGGVGMVLCWLGSMGVLPALVVVSERWRPMKFEAGTARASIYGRIFSKLVHAAPRSLAYSSVVLAIGATAVVVVAIRADPIEYDFRNLKSIRKAGDTEAVLINRRVSKIVPSTKRGDAIAMLAPTREDVPHIVRTLERQRDEEGAPHNNLRTIDALLPKDQATKVPILREVRDLLLDFRKYADADEKEAIDENIPPENLEAVDAYDLPEDAARAFSELDGTRGTMVFVEKARGYSLWDGKFLIQWTKWLRQVRTESGERPPIAGRPPIFADTLEVIWTDGPKAILASFVATLLLVVVAFRRMRERLFVMLALLFGIAWMGAWMAALSMRLNFLNFVAFPITFGNGVDYGVNVMRRYAQGTGPEAVRSSIEDTGGAVILCSLTTIIGYTSLYTSANQALNSFGAAMAISEVTCLLSAVLAMPAGLLLLERRRAATSRAET